jgi:excisionase family DNA binding protein
MTHRLTHCNTLWHLSLISTQLREKNAVTTQTTAGREKLHHVPPTGARLRSAQEVADYLGVPLTTLYQWRTKNAGPRAIRVGRHLRFRQEDVDAWVEQHLDEPDRGAA